MLPTGLSPMLAMTGALPVSDGWAYEVKWDGVRALVAATPHGVTAISRNGNDITGGYPELQALVGPEMLLDGELVALGSEGLPDFGLLQKRVHVRSPSLALVSAAPVSFVPFDVLHLGELSLLDQPYDTRRGALDDLGLDAPAAFFTGGAQVLASTRAQGLEGVVASTATARTCRGGARSAGSRSSTCGGSPSWSVAGSRARAAAPGASAHCWSASAPVAGCCTQGTSAPVSARPLSPCSVTCLRRSRGPPLRTTDRCRRSTHGWPGGWIRCS